VARNDDRTARPTVIDRLIDEDPRVAEDPQLSLNESVRRYKATVLRDLEWLLNTRRTITHVPDRYDEVRHSAFLFGLPDISSMSADSDPTRRRLLRDVEECIRIFEPRLSGIRVSQIDEAEGSQRRVRFVIEGLLQMEPNPERVLFDTVLDLTSGQIAVAGAG
jgi:type VI secretion system protein ImpF